MSDAATTTYRLSEVKEHNDGKSCWMVIHDKVYDITRFLDEHPGGEEVCRDMDTYYDGPGRMGNVWNADKG